MSDSVCGTLKGTQVLGIQQSNHVFFCTGVTMFDHISDLFDEMSLKNDDLR